MVIANKKLSVREQADTAGLAPMRIRTSQPEGCFAKEVSVAKHHWPCELRWGNQRQRHCRGSIEGTTAYATQLGFSFAESAGNRPKKIA